MLDLPKQSDEQRYDLKLRLKGISRIPEAAILKTNWCSRAFRIRYVVVLPPRQTCVAFQYAADAVKSSLRKCEHADANEIGERGQRVAFTSIDVERAHLLPASQRVDCAFGAFQTALYKDLLVPIQIENRGKKNVIHLRH